MVGGSALLGGRLRFGVREGARQELRYNTSTTQATLNLVYGKRIIGSNDVFVELTNKNKTLWIVHCLGEGEIEGIEVDTEGHPLITIAGRKFKDYPSGKIKYYFHSGTNDQLVDSHIQTAISKFTDTMRNTAYIVFELDFATFKTIPNREIVIKGIKLKDFTNPTVPPAWSDNPVLVLYDYVINSRYGLGWSPDLIDLDTWVSAKNYCDNHIKPWKFNYVINSQVSSQSIIDTILYHFRGVLTYYAGKLFCYYLEDAPSIFSVTDEHIVRSDDGLALVSVSQPSTHDLPNTALVRYVSPNLEWTDDDFAIGEAVSGKVRTIDFPGYTDRALAAEMAAYILERERLNRIYTATLRLDTVIIDVNDVINFSSTELLFGVDPTKKYRIKESVVLSDGLVQITFVEDNVELYDAVYNDNQERYIIDIYSPYDPPPPVINIVFEEELYTFRGRTFVRLKCTFEPPTEYTFYAYSNIYVRAGDIGEFTQLTSVVDNFSMESVEENITYYFRFWSVSTEGAISLTPAEANWSVVGISGVLPASPLDLFTNISGDTVTLTSTDFYNPDAILYSNVESWEFRAHKDIATGTYGGALLLARKSSPQYTFTGLAPGNYRFILDTFGTNANYGNVPVYKNETKFIPPNYALFFNNPVSYTTGSHNGTEESGGNLKCIITNPSLSGYYTTAPVILQSSVVTGKGLVSCDRFSGDPPDNTVVLESKDDWDAVSLGDEVTADAFPSTYVDGKTAWGDIRVFPDGISTGSPPDNWVETTLANYQAVFEGARIRWIEDEYNIIYVIQKKEIYPGPPIRYWFYLDATPANVITDPDHDSVAVQCANRLIVSAGSIPYFINQTFYYRVSLTGGMLAALDYEYSMSGVTPNNYAGGLGVKLYVGPSATGPWAESTYFELLTTNLYITTPPLWYYMRYDLTDYSPTPIPDPVTRKQIIIKPSTLKIYRRTQ